MTARREKAREQPLGTRCLDDLEGPTPGNRASQALPRPLKAARAVPIGQLSPAQLLGLLHQGVGIRHLFPYALAAAERDPWAMIEFHPGDLLLAVLAIDPGHWKPGTDLRKRMVKLAKAADQAAKTRPASDRNPETEADVKTWIERVGKG